MAIRKSAQVNQAWKPKPAVNILFGVIAKDYNAKDFFFQMHAWFIHVSCLPLSLSYQIIQSTWVTLQDLAGPGDDQ